MDVWRSILWGRDILALGVRWRVGDGSNIGVFSDAWLPRPLSFKPATVPCEDVQEWKVNQLLYQGTREWNVELIKTTFWPIDWDVIFSIPLGMTESTDRRIWHFDSKGCYTVRSGYHVAMNAMVEEHSSTVSSDNNWWRLLWNATMPSKVKICLWRVFHGILPTASSLAKRGINVARICLRCKEAEETLTHALFTCPAIQEVWLESIFRELWGTWESRPAYLILLQMAERGKRAEFEVFCMLVWMVWKDRNSSIHRGKALSATLLRENAGSYLFDFQSTQKVVSLCAKPANRLASKDRWCPPAVGSF